MQIDLQLKTATSMKHYYFLFLISLYACNTKTDSKNSDDQSVTVLNDTIPLTREHVQSAAVANYSEKVKDPLNDWEFAVSIFETKATFDFLVKVKYMELDAEDTLHVPNFGIMPKVELRKGPDDQSCIIGFLDKENAFRSQKLVAVKNKQLKISTIRHYARTRYKVNKK